MAEERFDMSVAAIRERYENWRALCEGDTSRVAADFWRDIGALLAELSTQGSKLQHCETLAADRLALFEDLAEAVQQAIIDWDTIDDWDTTREATEKNMRELSRLVRESAK